MWAAVAISMTNVTSAGQFAGLSLIFGGGTLFETALTQFVINLRYALMSLSLSQKLERRVGLIDRMLFSFMMTDEVFAVASGQKGEVGKRYLFGVMIAPYCGWALGTLCGAVASGFLPPSVRSALSIAIYGMFIAIVVPVAKQSRAVLGVVALAVALSCAMHWLPVLNTVSSGFSIILCTVLASGLGALAGAGAGRAFRSTGRGGGVNECKNHLAVHRGNGGRNIPYTHAAAGAAAQKLRSRFIKSFLFYVPYAVLAVMTVPAIFESTGSVFSATVGFAAAVLLAYRGAALLPVALAACGVVFCTEWMMRLF